MTDLLDEVMGWARGGSVTIEPTVLANVGATEDARLLAEAFTGEDGRKRLMILARLTVLRAPVDHTLDPQAALLYAARRQGQDSIFAALVKYLDIHAEKEKQAHDDRSRKPDDPDPFAGGRAGTADPRAGTGGWGEFDPTGAIGG